MPTILIVDDSGFSRKSLVRHVDRQQFSILEASDGVQALQVLSSHSIDLVITDLLMPNMDGTALLREIQQNFPRTPCLVVSADIQDSSRRTAEQLGAIGFLNKPVDAKQLNSAIKSALTEGVAS